MNQKKKWEKTKWVEEFVLLRKVKKTNRLKVRDKLN